jgi:hypothetical protein
MLQACTIGRSSRGKPRRTMTGWCRWLLVLYVLATGAPVLQAVAAHAAMAGQSVVDLCSAEGVRRIVLDPAGRPVVPKPADQHAGHDCTGCLTGCHQHGACPACGVGVADAWPNLRPDRREGAASPRAALSVRPPLPARGPPALA